MGILNTTPDSVSDDVHYLDVESQVVRARELVADGADLIDVGGESGRTDVAPVSADEEIARVLPLVERLVAEGIAVSVDTWKPEVARAVADAGAAMLNDVSGLRSPEIASIAASSGASLVLMHTRAEPKQEGFPGYDDVTGDVVDLLGDLVERARSLGVRDEQIVLDPGPDFAKTPAETVEVLRSLDRLDALGEFPLLLALSRKYFIGAITGRPPLDRLGGTLGAIAALADGDAILRVHDVAAVHDFLQVRAVLRGEAEVPEFDASDERLKWV